METQDNNDIIFIEDYLDGKLSNPEKERFMQRLESDEGFAKLYFFRLKIRDDWHKAKQYESVQQEVAGAIRNEKNKKQRTIIYAVAASLAFLVVISGVFSLLNQEPAPSQIIATDEDSTELELFDPQVKEPVSYADSGHFDPDSLEKELITRLEIQNDSLVFSWQPALKTATDLVILSQETGKEVFRKSLKADAEKTVLHRSELSAGKMVWYLEGFAERDSFELR